MNFAIPQRRRAVGLDIGSRVVKAMTLQRRAHGLRLTGVGVAPVEGAGLGQVAAAIHAALAQARADGEPVVAAIGGPEVVIRQVSLPPLPRTRIVSALEMQHREFGLLPPAEAVLDAQIFRRSNGDGSAKILAISAPRALVEERARLLQQAAVRVKILDVEALALLNGVLYLTELEPGELLVAVTVGQRRTTLCLFSEDGPVVARYLEVGAEAFTERLGLDPHIGPRSGDSFRREPAAPDPPEAEERCRDLIGLMAEEIRLSVAFYRSEYDRESLPRYVLGGWMGLPQLGGWLEDRLGLGSPFELMDPLQAFETEGPRSLDESSPPGPEFLQAFGLALRGL